MNNRNETNGLKQTLKTKTCNFSIKIVSVVHSKAYSRLTTPTDYFSYLPKKIPCNPICMQRMQDENDQNNKARQCGHMFQYRSKL